MSLVKREDSVESEEIIDLENYKEVEYREQKKSIWDKIKLILIIVVIIWILWFLANMLIKNSRTVLVDNPTSKEIVVKINSWWIDNKIPANSSLKVKIKKWENEVFLNWKSVWKFEKKITDFTSFLNPTLHSYISEFFFYTEEEDYEKFYEKENIKNITIDLNWKKATWPFKIYKDLYIKWNWNYWITKKSSPEELTFDWRYKLVEELFNHNDFIKTFEQYYSYDGEE